MPMAHRHRPIVAAGLVAFTAFLLVLVGLSILSLAQPIVFTAHAHSAVIDRTVISLGPSRGPSGLVLPTHNLSDPPSLFDPTRDVMRWDAWVAHSKSRGPDCVLVVHTFRLLGPIFALAILLWLRGWRVFIDPGPGKCQACGYCLIGATRSRCPECGEPVVIRA
jgi:hypothetical protein